MQYLSKKQFLPALDGSLTSIQEIKIPDIEYVNRGENEEVKTRELWEILLFFDVKEFKIIKFFNRGKFLLNNLWNQVLVN